MGTGSEGGDRGDQDSGIDEGILSELFDLLGGGGSEGLVQACEMFLAGVPSRFVDADSALRQGLFDDAARVAHSLRGTAGAFGAARLSLLADGLERACGERDSSKAGVLLDECRAEFETFAAVLRSRLQEATGR